MSQKPSPSGLHKNGVPVTDWPTIRSWVLNRDEHLCQTCKVNVANEVDHIWPRRLGGPDHIDNLRAICGPCNKAKGARVDLAAATEEQLTLARSALHARIGHLEAEHNDVINEHLRRRIASGESFQAKSLVRVVKADQRKQTQVLQQWEKLVDLAYPPERVSELVAALELAVMRLAGRDSYETAKACSSTDLLQIVRAYGVFAELVAVIMPGVGVMQPLRGTSTRSDVLAWLQAHEREQKWSPTEYEARQRRAAQLLTHMDTEFVTVDEADEARKKAQP